MENSYNHLNEYLKERYGERVLKICINAAFTCPNRDGKVGKGGCIFCSNQGSGELIKEGNIKSQVETFLNSYRGKRANKFIAYFQAYTNTYGSIETLKRTYDSALIDERIIALDVATRADCIDEEVCQLLASYRDKYDVFVELGLQSSNEKSHDFLNQKITNEQFIKAVDLLNKYHIEIIIHIMVGLPHEGHEDIVNTVKFLNSLNYQGLKIHSTYVIKNTILEQLYEDHQYTPLTEAEYFDELVYILTHINKDIIIHRIVADPDKTLLVAPLWTKHKLVILNRIDKYLLAHNLKQGCLYQE